MDRFGESRQLLSQSNEFDEYSELSWAADGNLLVHGPVRLLKLGADGRNQSQILADADAGIAAFSPCGSGYLVLTWVYHGGTDSLSVWRTNADGSSPLRLMNGSGLFPVCSPDQKWVYYKEWRGNHIYRVALDGSGQPEAVFSAPKGYFSAGKDISASPDGKTLAIAIAKAEAPVKEGEDPERIALFEPGSSSPPRILDASHISGGALQFTPDGVHRVCDSGVRSGQCVDTTTRGFCGSCNYRPDATKLSPKLAPPQDLHRGSISLTKEYSAMLSIRSGVVSDVALLRTLIQEFATFERLPVAITEEQLRQDGFGAQPKFRILIAECDGQPAGYALFFDCYSSFQGRGIFLEDLFVRPSLRGKNVGRALLAHVAKVAEEVNGFGVMFNVLDWNQKAIEFYQKIGATFLDDWKTVCLKNKALHDLASQVR